MKNYIFFIRALILFAIIHLSSNIMLFGQSQRNTDWINFEKYNPLVVVDLFDRNDNNVERLKMLELSSDMGVVITPNLPLLKEIVTKKPMALSVEIPIPNGKKVKVDLVRDYFEQSLTYTNENSIGSISYSTGVFYSGRISGNPESIVAFSFFENQCFGQWSSKTGNFSVQEKIGSFGKLHLVLNNNLETPLFRCKEFFGETIMVEQSYNKEIDDNSYNGYDQEKCVPIKAIMGFSLYESISGNVNGFPSGSYPYDHARHYFSHFYHYTSVLYDNENINLVVNLTIDTIQSMEDDLFDSNLPWDVNRDNLQATVSSWNYAQIRDNKIVHLLIDQGGGTSIATGYPNNPICGPLKNIAIIESPGGQVVVYPNFSLMVKIIAHELGHNLGSPHTHQCLWGPNGNQAIDNCDQFTQSGVNPPQPCFDPSNPIIPSSGTIMSYCDDVLNNSINFTNGFGQEPGNLIRKNVYGASCLTPCCTDGSHPLEEMGIAYNLTGTIGTPSGYYTRGAIVSSQNVSNPMSPGVEYYAEKYIDLLPVFNATSNSTSVFNAGITSCTYMGNVLKYHPSASNNESITLGVAKNENEKIIVVYPNPFTDITTVSFSEAGNYNLVVVDLTGKVVLATVNAGASKVNLNLSALNNGMYILKIVDANGATTTKKLVLQ